jgi:chromosome segregation ATPase
VHGPLANKTFSQKLRVLEEAVQSLQARASVLRDGVIVSTHKTGQRTEKVVNKVAATGAVVETRTRATLHHLRTLQSDTQDLKFSAEYTDAQLSSVNAGIKSFSLAQEVANIKLDNVEASQSQAHHKIETLSDLQQVREQASRAIELALETAECELPKFELRLYIINDDHRTDSVRRATERRTCNPTNAMAVAAA